MIVWNTPQEFVDWLKARSADEHKAATRVKTKKEAEIRQNRGMVYALVASTFQSSNFMQAIVPTDEETESANHVNTDLERIENWLIELETDTKDWLTAVRERMEKIKEMP